MPNQKPLVIAHWVARVITAAILMMGVIPKLTGNAGELAAVLPGGSAATITIGVLELAAVVLIFVPRTTMIGSAFAALIMLGAVGSHVVGPVGMEGDLGAMFPLAVVAFLAAASATAIAWKRGYRPLPPVAG